MAKKSELLKKKWSQLSSSERDLFKSKSTFSRLRQAQLTINQGTPEKSKKAVVTAIQQDKGELKPRDVERISNETGVSPKKITKLAINRVPAKTVRETRADLTEGKGKKGAIIQLAADGKLSDKDIKFLTKNYPGIKASDINKFLDKDRNADVKGPESKIKTTIRDTRLTIKPGEGPGTETKTDTKTDTGTDTVTDTVTDTGKGNGKDKEDGFDPNYDPLGEIKFPKGTSGKDFRKYKTQRGKIREAAEKDLENRMKQSFKPEVLGEAATLKEKFLGDPTKPRKKLTGRAKREDRIQQVKERQIDLGIRRKPKFEEYEERVEEIRKGKGAAKEYAYSGRFDKLGKRLGVKYGEKAREKRTESRLTDLRKNIGAGPKKTYKTAADNAESQRKKGRKAMESFKIG